MISTANAVEVTKLSLLLKCLEGETQASIKAQFSLFNERVLPTLDSNIKCGNSLVDTDFFEIESDRAVLKKVKPFNWESNFPEVFKQSGFDVVIGNPPYFNISILNKNIIKYLALTYSEIHTGYNDIMYYFAFKVSLLLNENGVSSMIISNYFLGNKYAQLLRSFLKNKIESIINFKNYLVFSEANIHTCIISLNKSKPVENILFYELTKDEIIKTDLQGSCNLILRNRNELKENWLIAQGAELLLLEKVKTHEPLGNISIIEKGSTSGKNSIFTVSTETIKKRKFEKSILRKNIKNGDIEKYYIKESGDYLIYVDNDTQIESYPNIYAYLKENKTVLSSRNEVKKKMYSWYRLERPRNKTVFDSKEKIVVPYRATKNRFAYDNEQSFNDGGDIRVIVLKDTSPNIKFVLGLLNSKLINWFYGFIGKPKGKTREYFNEPLGEIPIPQVNFKVIKLMQAHDKIVDYVELVRR